MTDEIGKELTVSDTINHSGIMPAMPIEIAISRRAEMIEFVRKIMHDGTDYGLIPGTEKKTLLKPGAEKLITFFGFSVSLEILTSNEEWRAEEPLFFYLYRVSLHKDGKLVAEGDGSANSMESKHRYRWITLDDLPGGTKIADLLTKDGTISEFQFAIDKAQTSGKYGKPAEYWQKFNDAIADGSAAPIERHTKNGDRPAYEIKSTLYRIPNPDIANQVNTIQKMAQKRALVCAVLVACNASEFFTQDMEDMSQSSFSPPASSDIVEVKPKESAQVSREDIQEAKPNGGSVGGDPTSQFWLKVRGLGMDSAAANTILAENNRDFAAAFKVLEAQHTPPVNDVIPAEDDIPF